MLVSAFINADARLIGYFAGTVIMLGSIFALWRSFRRRDRCTVPVKAQVVQIREEEVETINDGVPITSTTYIPVFRFTLASGRVVVTEGNFGDAAPKYEVGEFVELRCNPDDPREIDVPRDSRMTVILCLAGFAAGAGCFIYCMFFLN